MDSLLKKTVLSAICSAFFFANAIAHLEVAAQVVCTNQCNTGDCWKLDGTCWKTDKITCCDWGSWASQSSGKKNGTGSIVATDRPTCTAECPSQNNTKGKEDSRASCDGIKGNLTMTVDDCTCY